MTNKVLKNSISGDQLILFIERFERLKSEKKQIADDQKVVMAEASSAGFSPKIILHCVKVRAMKPSDYQEVQSLADMYLSALGMNIDPPLFRAANLISVDIAAKEQVIEALKNFVPENGSIEINAGGPPIRLTRGKDGQISVMEIEKKKDCSPSPSDSSPIHQKEPAPDVDADGAQELGLQAAKNDVAIIKNPFPYGDARRPRWDRGWRIGSGNDGMGPS